MCYVYTPRVNSVLGVHVAREYCVVCTRCVRTVCCVYTLRVNSVLCVHAACELCVACPCACELCVLTHCTVSCLREPVHQTTLPCWRPTAVVLESWCLLVPTQPTQLQLPTPSCNCPPYFKIRKKLSQIVVRMKRWFIHEHLNFVINQATAWKVFW